MDPALVKRIDEIESTRPGADSPVTSEVFTLLDGACRTRDDLKSIVERYAPHASPGMLNVVSFVLADKTELAGSEVVELCMDIVEKDVEAVSAATLANFLVMLRNVADQWTSIPRSVDWHRVGKIIKRTVDHVEPGTGGVLAVRNAFWVLQALWKQGLLDLCFSSRDVDWILDRVRGDSSLQHEHITEEAKRLVSLMGDRPW